MKSISRKSKTFAFLTFFLLFGFGIPSALSLVFPGTYSFEGEVGVKGTNISFIDGDDSGSSCVAQVVERAGDHDEVLELSDDSGSGIVKINNNFASTQATGSIELYIRSDNVYYGLTIKIASATGDTWDDGIIFFIQSDKAYFDVGSGNEIENVNDDTWYLIKVEWNCEAETWSAWIDGEEVFKDGGFSQSETAVGFGGIQMETVGGHSGYDYYIDAIKYSWDALGGLPSWLIPTIIGGIATAGGIAVVVIVLKRRQMEVGPEGTKAPRAKKARTPKAFSRESRIQGGKVVPTAQRIRGGQVVEKEASPVVSSPSATRFCPSCGKSATAGTTICESCGNVID